MHMNYICQLSNVFSPVYTEAKHSVKNVSEHLLYDYVI